jgi:hypothetical protein
VSKKQRLREARISEPNFSSAPEVRETKIGAHPLLWYINFLVKQ